MKLAEFNDDGIIYSRGEKIASYEYGDQVTVLSNVTDNLVRVVVNEGESKGRILTIDKQLITIY